MLAGGGGGARARKAGLAAHPPLRPALPPRLRTEGRRGTRAGGECGAAPTAGGARGPPGGGRAGAVGGKGVYNRVMGLSGDGRGSG